MNNNQLTNNTVAQKIDTSQLDPVNLKSKNRRLQLILIIFLPVLFGSGIFILYRNIFYSINRLPTTLKIQMGEKRNAVEKKLGSSEKTELTAFGNLVLYSVDQSNFVFNAVGYNSDDQVIYISEFLPNQTNATLENLTKSWGQADESWFSRQGNGDKVYIFKNNAIILTTDATGKVVDITRYAKEFEFEILRQLRQYLFAEDPFIL